MRRWSRPDTVHVYYGVINRIYICIRSSSWPARTALFPNSQYFHNIMFIFILHSVSIISTRFALVVIRKMIFRPLLYIALTVVKNTSISTVSSAVFQCRPRESGQWPRNISIVVGLVVAQGWMLEPSVFVLSSIKPVYDYWQHLHSRWGTFSARP